MRGVNHVLRLLLRLASGSSKALTERFFLQQKQRTSASAARRTAPPTAIPIIAPKGNFEELEDDPFPDPGVLGVRAGVPGGGGGALILS